MGHPRITPEQRAKFASALTAGCSVKEAARRAGVSYGWAKAEAAGMKNSSGGAYTEVRTRDGLPGPIPLDQLTPDARAALDDIALFARRYFGLICMPFQVEGIEVIEDCIAEPCEEGEFVVDNQPPGTGKSTFWTCVVPAWMTARNRAIRGLLGSGSDRTAERYLIRLANALTRRTPIKAKPQDVAMGIAVDAVATLAHDYGRFRPLDGEWSRRAITVEQADGEPVSEKEATWQAFGRTAGFIGNRVDVSIWDDAYDSSKTKTAEAREELFTWWGDIAEQRVEPRGLLLLVGQRLGPTDLYRHALNQRIGEDEEEAELDAVEARVEQGDAEEAPLGRRPGHRYRHIVFRAHYEDRCRGDETHGADAPPYPDGCLLYPRRLPWRKCAAIRRNNPKRWSIVFQQEDGDPTSVLVREIWVRGGVDQETGELYPGCWDEDRGLCERPQLQGRAFSAVTVDPAPSNYWSIQRWVHDAGTNNRLLVDLLRRRMKADELLDWRHALGTWTGVLEEWWHVAKETGLPFSHVVVEQNAAQKFLLQYEHVRRWMSARDVIIVGHETQRNKADPERGVETIAPHWRFGRVRLPGRDYEARRQSEFLVREVTRYPESETRDCVLAQWFFEFRLPLLSAQEATEDPARRPGFLRGTHSRGLRQLVGRPPRGQR